MKELGIYGGTFAPIHNGHLLAARVFYDTVGLDELLVVPTFLPPHKDATPDDDPQKRLEMARLAFSSERERRIEVCDYEIKKQGKSYTCETLAHFTAPDTRLTFLCGTDMFLTIDSWRHPEKIFSLARIAHMPRETLTEEMEGKLREKAEHYRQHYGAELLFLDAVPFEVSSSQIRERCARGESVDNLVPASVSRYISENRLYRSR